ncbi:phosphotransferase [Chitinilyticum litopenaei]|uniref:phosphotransferase n=1 Tax=Chitinilyticum litopenaei TaxID=1121276 RepID=UPI00041239F5|nr:phosphotransferase [Chitinilyticum litopenaei]
MSEQTGYAEAAQAWYIGNYQVVPERIREIAGFYGHVVMLAGPETQPAVAVKFAFQDGRCAREITALERLRPHSSLPLPAVVAQTSLSVAGGNQPHEVLVLAALPGVAPWDLPPASVRAPQAATEVARVLAAVHGVSDPRGFECPDASFTPSLLGAFEAWFAPVWHYAAADAAPFSPALRSKLAALWAARSALLAPINAEPSSLVHDDPHLGNLLFDAQTGLPTALLDPCDVAFRHREQDVFHLADAMPDWRVMEAYEALSPMTAGWEVRRWFFSIWDDVKHSRNRGWYDEDWFERKFIQLRDALQSSHVYQGIAL